MSKQGTLRADKDNKRHLRVKSKMLVKNEVIDSKVVESKVEVVDRRLLSLQKHVERKKPKVKVGPLRKPVSITRLPDRNAPCTCGSTLKFKKCCAKRIAEQESKLRKAIADMKASQGLIGPPPVFEPESVDVEFAGSIEETVKAVEYSGYVPLEEPLTLIDGLCRACEHPELQESKVRESKVVDPADQGFDPELATDGSV